MIRITKLHSTTNGNSHTVSSVLCIIMSLLMLIFIDIYFEMLFASKRENRYLNRSCDINKENVQMKLFIYL
jgi:accessory gene regulator protein AgrB